MKKYNAPLHSATTLLGLSLLIGAPVHGEGPPNAAPPAASAGQDSPRDRFDHRTLRLDVDARCKADSSIQKVQREKLRSDLYREIQPILEEGDSSLRKQLALNLTARDLYQRGRTDSSSFIPILKKLGNEQLEQTVSALDDLRARVLLIARMRDVRASIADMAIKDGKPQLTLKTPPADPDEYAVAAPAIMLSFQTAGNEGMDCSSSEVYQLFAAAPRDNGPATYQTIKHVDLQKLYDEIIRLNDDFTARIASGKKKEKQDFSEVMTVYNDTSAWFDKALKVLGNALELQNAYLDAHVKRSAPPPPPAPEPVAALVSPAASASANAVELEKKAAAEAALESRKAAFLADIHRQETQLRVNRSSSAIPIGVANNLLGRIQRTYQFAKLMVADEQVRETYETDLSDGLVHVQYSETKAGLKSIRITVDEKSGKSLLLTWYISLERKDDSNYRMTSELNGIQAAIDVENAEIKRAPNYQQLMVLMNRLGNILDKK